MGGDGMALEYTEEKLNSLDKETIIQLFLSQQKQLKQRLLLKKNPVK